VEEELALVALDASLRSYASLRMTAIVVGGNEKARREAGLFLLALVMAPKARVPGRRVLLGGHFFGFAFLAHHFEFAFCFLEGCLYFRLDLGCRFFELR